MKSIRMGIAQSPEGRRIFGRMTVLENLQMGAQLVDDKHFEDDLKRGLRPVPAAQGACGSTRAETLSGGEQADAGDRAAR